MFENFLEKDNSQKKLKHFIDLQSKFYGGVFFDFRESVKDSTINRYQFDHAVELKTKSFEPEANFESVKEEWVSIGGGWSIQVMIDKAGEIRMKAVKYVRW